MIDADLNMFWGKAADRIRPGSGVTGQWGNIIVVRCESD
jgi:hypothetical protein